jgi:uncharacterized protein YjbJ (UPF0337 family)
MALLYKDESLNLNVWTSCGFQVVDRPKPCKVLELHNPPGERIMGEFIDKIKGKVKEAAGKVTGNKELQSEGVADQLKGEAKGRFEEAKTDLKKAARQSSDDSRRSNPVPNASNR